MDTNSTKYTVGILHMGTMGASLAGEIRKNGHTVITGTSGRSENTIKRSCETGVIDLKDPRLVFETADIVISICSGGGYKAISRMAEDLHFKGLFVDANSMPDYEAEILWAKMIPKVPYVDASIYGYPIPWPETFTQERKIYASGEDVHKLRSLFDGTAFDVHETKMLGKIAKNMRIKGLSFQ